LVGDTSSYDRDFLSQEAERAPGKFFLERLDDCGARAYDLASEDDSLRVECVYEAGERGSEIA
jgi:hypothetical protein